MSTYSRSDGGSSKTKEKPKLVSSVSEMEKIRLSRFKMEKFVHLPIFAKAVIGCYVRIGIGNNQGRPVYRVSNVLTLSLTYNLFRSGLI